jgi:hypothetical protein
MRNIVNSSGEKESPIKKISHHIKAKQMLYYQNIYKKRDRWQAKSDAVRKSSFTA